MQHLSFSTISEWLKILMCLCVIVFVLEGCKKDEEENDESIFKNSVGTAINPTDTLPFEPIQVNPLNPCNDSYLPLVMVHGVLASGDTYALQIMRFTSNGYCNDRLFTFDWNSIGNGIDNAALLDEFIDEVLNITNVDKVELVGHSAGGSLGYNYLSNPARAAKVAHYVHIGSGVQSGPAGNGSVPTLNIWSEGDEVVSGGDISGATNVKLTDADHYQVATSVESFEAMVTFFRGISPQTSEILGEHRFKVGGKAVTLGENAPLSGATVRVYEVNPETGWRITEQPQATFITDSKGFWGDFMPKPNTPYEFFIQSTVAGDRPVHYYREGFTHTNTHVYLRTLPPPGSLAGILLGGLPKNDNQSVVAVFASSQAVINGRDELFINSTELSSANFAPASKTAIAFFVYDANNNQTTDNTAITLFGLTPFLAGVDVFLPASEPSTISLTLNNRNLNIRNWPSESEGIIVPVFD